MYLTYIHTVVVQAARVQISCIPGMITTRFFSCSSLPDRSMEYGICPISILE